MFDSLSPWQQLQQLENMGTLGRAWVRPLATCEPMNMSDEEIRYAIRRTGLCGREGERAGGNGRCIRSTMCGQDTPSHHLSCRANGYIRTHRHTSVVWTLHDRLKEVRSVHR